MRASGERSTSEGVVGRVDAFRATGCDAKYAAMLCVPEIVPYAAWLGMPPGSNRDSPGR